MHLTFSILSLVLYKWSDCFVGLGVVNMFVDFCCVSKAPKFSIASVFIYMFRVSVFS